MGELVKWYDQLRTVASVCALGFVAARNLRTTRAAAPIALEPRERRVRVGRTDRRAAQRGQRGA
jgi:hypothetical protein